MSPDAQYNKTEFSARKDSALGKDQRVVAYAQMCHIHTVVFIT